jgi:hypothetical protein
MRRARSRRVRTLECRDRLNSDSAPTTTQDEINVVVERLTDIFRQDWMTSGAQPIEGLINSYTRWRSSRLGQITDALERRLLFELVGPVVGKTLLDVGCGEWFATGPDPLFALLQ